MYHDLDEFNKLMGQVEAKSTFIPKSPNNESALDLGNYNMDPVHEGILQNGINRMSNILSANLKSKISSEWKHLDEDERKLLLRTIAGNTHAFGDDKGVDVALAQAFKDGTLSPIKAEDGTAAIVINKDVDISNSGASKFPQMSIEKINGELKCNYSSFSTFVGFPQSVKSIEFAKGKSQIEDLTGLPETTGRNAANYAIDLKNTKINSLKGWKVKGSVKGHVSFRGCDLKDINVDSAIYIAGSLDIRDNPNISIESLKAIVLKDYSKNQIIVKGQIYNTLEQDGFYSSKKIKPDEYSQENLGVLNEASANKQGVAVSQEELWKIGPEIIKQAEARKLKKEQGSIQDTLTQTIKPEVEALVSNMASSQLDRNSVAQANQKITSGMTSDEFRAMMKGLFDNLLKQLNELMRNTNGGDSSQVERSIDTITKVTAENAATEMEKFEKIFDDMLAKGGCLDVESLTSSLDSIINSISPLASASAIALKDSLTKMKNSSADRSNYETAVGDFLKILYIDVLGYSKYDQGLISQIVDGCFGEESDEATGEDIPEIKVSNPEEISASEPTSTPDEPKAPEPAPEAPVAPAPTPAPTPAPKAPAKPSKAPTPAKPVAPKASPAEPVKAKAPPAKSTPNYTPKQAKGIERFKALMGANQVKSEKNETKSEEK